MGVINRKPSGGDSSSGTLIKTASGVLRIYPYIFDNSSLVASSDYFGYQLVSNIQVVNGKLSRTSSNIATGRLITNATYTDGAVIGNFTMAVGVGDVGIQIRVGDNELGGYMLYIDASRNLSWYKVNGPGNYAILASNISTGVPDTAELKVISAGNSHALYLNGVLISTQADATIASGHGGVFLSGGVSSTPTADSFSVAMLGSIKITGLPTDYNIFTSEGLFFGEIADISKAEVVSIVDTAGIVMKSVVMSPGDEWTFA